MKERTHFSIDYINSIKFNFASSMLLNFQPLAFVTVEFDYFETEFSQSGVIPFDFTLCKLCYWFIWNSVLPRESSSFLPFRYLNVQFKFEQLSHQNSRELKVWCFCKPTFWFLGRSMKVVVDVVDRCCGVKRVINGWLAFNLVTYRKGSTLGFRLLSIVLLKRLLTSINLK